jgi:hypothetical protein
MCGLLLFPHRLIPAPYPGTMRGKFVPEEVRSTIMNIFRIGLNLIVVIVLWNVRLAVHVLPVPALLCSSHAPCAGL